MLDWRKATAIDKEQSVRVQPVLCRWRDVAKKEDELLEDVGDVAGLAPLIKRLPDNH